MALASPLDVRVVEEMRLVNARFGIGGKRVGDQVAQAGLENKDDGIGSQKECNVGAVGLNGSFGTDDDGLYDGRL